MSRNKGTQKPYPSAPLDIDKIFYRDLQRMFVLDMLQKNGDFLLRTGSGGGIVLSVNHDGEITHFKFANHQKEYCFENGLHAPAFGSLSDCLNHHYRTRERISKEGTELLNPLTTQFELIAPTRIKLEKQLGAGNFGQVWKAKLAPAKSGEKEEIVAIKVLTNGSADDRRDCLAEARIMTMLDHENVVKIKGICFGACGGGEPQLQMILELCNAGSLDKLLEGDKLTEEGKAHGLLDAAKGMAYLHEREVIHRDIASRNCLAHKVGNRTVVKIADYGLSRLAPDHYTLTTKRKLPVFSMSPESLMTREWSKASDVWSFGILILEMYNKGHNPYEQYYNSQKTDIKLMIKDLEAGKRVDPPAGTPPELNEIVKKCMQTGNRPTMDAVVGMLTKYSQKKK